MLTEHIEKKYFINFTGIVFDLKLISNELSRTKVNMFNPAIFYMNQGFSNLNSSLNLSLALSASCEYSY